MIAKSILILFLAASMELGEVTSLSTVIRAQTSTTNKPHFAVISIRENKTGEPPYSNFPLGPGPAFGVKGGLLIAKNQTLMQYIVFAFKPDMLQTQQFKEQLPAWARTASYDIEARADGNPTKDDMRLMMQALLEERFRMLVHHKTGEQQAYAMVLAKPETLGPRLKQHPADDPDCSKTVFTKTTTGRYPICGATASIVPEIPGDFAIVGYNVSMDSLAPELDRMAALGGVASLVQRRVVNRTGLIGTFDYTLEFSPEQALSAEPNADVNSGSGGVSFTKALNGQLGLKLIPLLLPTEVIVIDRIERPTQN